MEQTNGPRWERPDAPLGTLVYRAGLLSKDKLEAALEEGQRSGRRLGEILLQKGWIDEKDLARLLAGQRGLQYVSLKGRGYELQAARLLTERVCRYHNAIPIELTGDTVLVAIADPTDESANDEIRDELKRAVNFVVATASEIRSAIDEVFGGAQAAQVAVAGGAPSAISPIVAEHGLRIAAPVPEPEPEPVAAEPVLTPVPAPDPEPVAAAEPVAEPEPEYAPEPPGPAEPTIERNEDAHVSVAFHAAPEPVHEPEPVREPAPVHEPEPQPAAAREHDAYRLVLNLEGGEEVDVALFADEAEAVAAARELVAGIAKDGEWPQVGTKFLPPDRIASVEVREKQTYAGDGDRAGWVS